MLMENIIQYRFLFVFLFLIKSYSQISSEQIGFQNLLSDFNSIRTECKVLLYQLNLLNQSTQKFYLSRYLSEGERCFRSSVSESEKEEEARYVLEEMSQITSFLGDDAQELRTSLNAINYFYINVANVNEIVDLNSIIEYLFAKHSVGLTCFCNFYNEMINIIVSRRRYFFTTLSIINENSVIENGYAIKFSYTDNEVKIIWRSFNKYYPCMSDFYNEYMIKLNEAQLYITQLDECRIDGNSNLVETTTLISSSRRNVQIVDLLNGLENVSNCLPNSSLISSVCINKVIAEKIVKSTGQPNNSTLIGDITYTGTFEPTELDLQNCESNFNLLLLQNQITDCTSESETNLNNAYVNIIQQYQNEKGITFNFNTQIKEFSYPLTLSVCQPIEHTRLLKPIEQINDSKLSLDEISSQISTRFLQDQDSSLKWQNITNYDFGMQDIMDNTEYCNSYTKIFTVEGVPKYPISISIKDMTSQCSGDISSFFDTVKTYEIADLNNRVGQISDPNFDYTPRPLIIQQILSVFNNTQSLQLTMFNNYFNQSINLNSTLENFLFTCTIKDIRLICKCQEGICTDYFPDTITVFNQVDKVWSLALQNAYFAFWNINGKYSYYATIEEQITVQTDSDPISSTISNYVYDYSCNGNESIGEWTINQITKCNYETTADNIGNNGCYPKQTPTCNYFTKNAFAVTGLYDIFQNYFGISTYSKYLLNLDSFSNVMGWFDMWLFSGLTINTSAFEKMPQSIAYLNSLKDLPLSFNITTSNSINNDIAANTTKYCYINSIEIDSTVNEGPSDINNFRDEMSVQTGEIYFNDHIMLRLDYVFYLIILILIL